MGIRAILERLFPRGTTEFDVSMSRFTSSNVKVIQYSTKDSVLLVEFKNGGRYLYQGVPEPLVQKLKRAKSKGKFLAAHVKGVYKVKKLDQ